MQRKVAAGVLLATTILVGACSKRSENEEAAYAPNRVTTADIAAPQNKYGMREAIGGEEAAAPAAMVAPGISPTAAPGVAFSYRYAFVLPDTAIAAVQEQHASACEKLGPTQCRITGMRYTLVDENQVEAYLQFKLAPELARNFGKDGIAAVTKADGTLVDAAIEGRDVGSQITASQRRTAELQSELARIEAQLAGGKLANDEREIMRARAEAIRQQLSSEKQVRSDGEVALANTPMTFTYAGKQGFTLGSNPIGDAAHGAWASFAFMVSTILIALGYALPWLVLAVLLLLAWRSGPVRRLRAALRPAATKPAEMAPPAD